MKVINDIKLYAGSDAGKKIEKEMREAGRRIANAAPKLEKLLPVRYKRILRPLREVATILTTPSEVDTPKV